MAEESKVEIKISADGGPAAGAVRRVAKALEAARTAAGGLMRALGTVGLAIRGVQLVADAIRTAYAWMTRGRTAAEELGRKLEQARYERGVEAAAKAYRELNAEIERTIRLEKERAAIAERRTAKRRDAEDARLELAKQLEIAALDPASKDYGKRKREIEDRYAAKAADTAAARTKEDLGEEAEGLRKELAAVERKIAGQKASREKDLADAGAAREEIDRRVKGRAWLDAMGPLGGKEREANEGRIEELKKQEKAARNRAESKAEAIQAAEEAAAILREKIEVVVGAGAGAGLRAEAAKMAIAQGAREREAAAARDAEEKARDAEEKEKADEKKRLELAKQQEIAELEIDDPRYREKRTAIERKYAYQAADGEAETLAIDNEIRAEAAEEERAARDERIDELGGFADRLAATEGVSANRLTALGLGSGVDGRGGIAGDVRKIIDLLKEEIDATKANKPEPGDGTATVGE